MWRCWRQTVLSAVVLCGALAACLDEDPAEYGRIEQYEECDPGGSEGGALVGPSGRSEGNIAAGESVRYTATARPGETLAFSVDFADPAPLGTVTVTDLDSGVVLDIIEVGTLPDRTVVPGPAEGLAFNGSVFEDLHLGLDVSSEATCIGFTLDWTLGLYCPAGPTEEDLTGIRRGEREGNLSQGTTAFYTFALEPLETLSFEVDVTQIDPATVSLIDVQVGIVEEYNLGLQPDETVIPGPVIDEYTNPSLSNVQLMAIAITSEAPCTAYHVSWWIEATCSYEPTANQEDLTGLPSGSRSGQIAAGDLAQYLLTLGPLQDLTLSAALDNDEPAQVVIYDWFNYPDVVASWDLGVQPDGTVMPSEVQTTLRNHALVNPWKVLVQITPSAECSSFTFEWEAASYCPYMPFSNQEDLAGLASGSRSGPVAAGDVAGYALTLQPLEKLTIWATLDTDDPAQVVIYDWFNLPDVVDFWNLGVQPDGTVLPSDVETTLYNESLINPWTVLVQIEPTADCSNFTFEWDTTSYCPYTPFSNQEDLAGQASGLRSGLLAAGDIAGYTLTLEPLEEVSLAAMLDTPDPAQVVIYDWVDYPEVVASWNLGLQPDGTLLPSEVDTTLRNESLVNPWTVLVRVTPSADCSTFRFEWDIASYCPYTPLSHQEDLAGLPSGSRSGLLAQGDLAAYSFMLAPLEELTFTAALDTEKPATVVIYNSFNYPEVLASWDLGLQPDGTVIPSPVVGSYLNPEPLAYQPILVAIESEADCTGFEFDWAIEGGLCTDDEEPNNAPGLATTVPSGGGSFADLTAETGDADWFSVGLAPGEGFVATATFAAAGTHLVVAYSTPGNTLVDFAVAQPAGPGLQEAVVQWVNGSTAPASALVFVMSNATCAPYELDVQVFGTCEDDHNEPDDHRLTATPLPAGHSSFDDLTISGADVDWFVATVPGRGSVTVRIPTSRTDGRELTLWGPTNRDLLAQGVVQELPDGSAVVEARFTNDRRIPRLVFAEVTAEACGAYDLEASVCGPAGCGPR